MYLLQCGYISMNAFIEHLNSHIQKHPDNLSTIARNAYLSRPSLYDLINGKNLPRPSTLKNLCSALSLSHDSTKKLQDFYQFERQRTSRKDQDKYLRQKKILMTEVTTLLLSKGHEISRPKELGWCDLILRNNTKKIPIIICPTLHDHSATLGSLLSTMFHLSTDKGYVCISSLSPKDRSFLPLFAKYDTIILSLKSLLQEIK